MDFKNLKMRKIRRDDIETLNTIFNQQLDEATTHLEICPWTESDRLTWLNSHSPKHPVYVGEIEDKIVCWCSINPYRTEYYYSGVATIELHIDKSVGESTTALQRSLVKLLERQALKLSYHKLMVMAATSNPQLLNMYRSLNFRDVGVLRQHGFYKGELADMTLLERCLQINVKSLTEEYRKNYPFYEEYFQKQQNDYETQMRNNGMIPSPDTPGKWIFPPAEHPFEIDPDFSEPLD